MKSKNYVLISSRNNKIGRKKELDRKIVVEKDYLKKHKLQNEDGNVLLKN